MPEKHFKTPKKRHQKNTKTTRPECSTTKNKQTHTILTAKIVSAIKTKNQPSKKVQKVLKGMEQAQTNMTSV